MDTRPLAWSAQLSAFETANILTCPHEYASDAERCLASEHDVRGARRQQLSRVRKSIRLDDEFLCRAVRACLEQESLTATPWWWESVPNSVFQSHVQDAQSVLQRTSRRKLWSRADILTQQQYRSELLYRNSLVLIGLSLKFSPRNVWRQFRARRKEQNSSTDENCRMHDFDDYESRFALSISRARRALPSS